jgi:hypothetical protein
MFCDLLWQHILTEFGHLQTMNIKFTEVTYTVVFDSINPLVPSISYIFKVRCATQKVALKVEGACKILLISSLAY